MRSSCETDWSFHIHTVKVMLLYFAAAGNWHYLRYATVYLNKMTKLPTEILHTFPTGEHNMRHCN